MWERQADHTNNNTEAAWRLVNCSPCPRPRVGRGAKTYSLAQGKLRLGSFREGAGQDAGGLVGKEAGDWKKPRDKSG